MIPTDIHIDLLSGKKPLAKQMRIKPLKRSLRMYEASQFDREVSLYISVRDEVTLAPY